MRSGYIYGGCPDMQRMCLTRGFDIHKASEDRMRAMLRNNKNDSGYIFIDWERYYLPFIGNNDVDPKILLPRLNYRNYSPTILQQYLVSSELYNPSEDTWENMQDLCRIIERYDESIRASGYELGNRSDILRMCENRAISDRSIATIRLRQMLRDHDSKESNDSEYMKSMTYYWNLNMGKLEDYIKESVLFKRGDLVGRKGYLISRLLDYDELIKKSNYTKGNNEDIIRICKSRNINVNDIDTMRRILRDSDREIAVRHSSYEDSRDSEKDELLKKNV